MNRPGDSVVILEDERVGERLNGDAILALTEDYRDDQVVAFGARRPDRRGRIIPHYFAAPTAGEFRSWLPELWRYELDVAQASYWIMQPMSPSLRRELPTQANGYKTTYFPAKNDAVDAFNCLPIDLDVGREGLPTAGDAIKIVANAVLADELPAPSYMALSGRGAYAIWRVRDPDGGLPENNAINRTRWSAILYRLILITKALELSPDNRAANPARWLKLPGTVDTLLVNGRETKSGNRVMYLPFLLDSPSARPAVYTFDELEQALGMVSLPPDALPSKPSTPPLQLKARRQGRLDNRDGSYVHAARVNEIIALSNSRGGMREGHRHMTLFYFYGSVRALYACRLPGEGIAEPIARERTYELNATFNPPLSDDEVESAIKRNNAGNKAKWKSQTLANALDVAPSEAEALGLHAIAPKTVRDSREQLQRGEVLDRKRARAQRAEMIRSLILLHPRWSDLTIAREVGGIDRQLVTHYRKALADEGLIPKPRRRPPKQLALLP